MFKIGITTFGHELSAIHSYDTRHCFSHYNPALPQPPRRWIDAYTDDLGGQQQGFVEKQAGSHRRGMGETIQWKID